MSIQDGQDATAANLNAAFVTSEAVGAPGGVANLDPNAVLYDGQIPKSAKNVIEIDSITTTEEERLIKRIYLEKSTGKSYRWEPGDSEGVGMGWVLLSSPVTSDLSGDEEDQAPSVIAVKTAIEEATTAIPQGNFITFLDESGTPRWRLGVDINGKFLIQSKGSGSVWNDKEVLDQVPE